MVGVAGLKPRLIQSVLSGNVNACSKPIADIWHTAFISVMPKVLWIDSTRKHWLIEAWVAGIQDLLLSFFVEIRKEIRCTARCSQAVILTSHHHEFADSSSDFERSVALLDRQCSRYFTPRHLAVEIDERHRTAASRIRLIPGTERPSIESALRRNCRNVGNRPGEGLDLH